jgi:hypothetical protein
MAAFVPWSATPASPTDLLQSATAFHSCAALVDGSNTASRFQIGAANSTVTAETVAGRAAIKLGELSDVGGFSSIMFTHTGPFALAGTRSIHFLLYCTNWLALSQFSAIQIQFDNAGSPDSTNYLSCVATPTAWVDGNWCLLTAQFSEAGTTSMSYVGTAATVQSQIVTGNVRRVFIRVQTGAGVPDVFCGGVWFGGRSRPKAIISYDGCYVSQRDVALVKHQLYDIPGTLYVTRNTLGTTGRISDADLDTFYAAGWAIAMHSQTSQGYEEFGSTQQIVDEIGSFQQWQASRGFKRGLGHLCWPYTAPTTMNAAQRAVVMPALLQSGVKTIRHGASQSPVSAKNLVITGTGESPLHVFSPQLKTNGTPVTVATALEHLRAPARAGSPAHVYIHEVTPNGSTGGGNGSSNSVGTNYWRDDFFSGSATAFMELMATDIAAGIYDGETIAYYDDYV